MATPPIVVTMLGKEYALTPRFTEKRVAFYSTDRIEFWIDGPRGKFKLSGRFTLSMQKGLVFETQ